MKKLIIAALLVVGFSSFAQEQNQRGQRDKMTPEQRTQAQLDKLTTDLKLDAKQQEQIKPILAEQTAKREAMRAERMASNGGQQKELTKEEREALKVKRNEEKAVTDNQFKAILTPEQFKKMKDIEQANMEKMRAARESRQGGEGRDNGGNGGNGGNQSQE